MYCVIGMKVCSQNCILFGLLLLCIYKLCDILQEKHFNSMIQSNEFVVVQIFLNFETS